VAGGVLAGADRFLYSIDFHPQDSIALLAVVLMGGVYSMYGAVIAALLNSLLPAALQDWGVSQDWLTILFGIGVVQVLTTAPAGIVDQFPRDMKRLGGLLWRLVRRPAPGAPAASAPPGAPGASRGGKS
jgi:branched-chain amino acid transport system permease protein